MLPALMTGCVTYPFQAYEGERLPETETARIGVHGSARGMANYPWLIRVDEFDWKARWDQEGSQATQVRPGRHVVTAKMHWSNGFAEEVKLTFNAKVGHSYTIRAYECLRGEKMDPKNIGVYSDSQIFWESTGVSMAQGAADGLAPIILGLWFIEAFVDGLDGELNEDDPPRDRRLLGHDFYHWIADLETNAVVAGRRPPLAEEPSTDN